MRFEKSALLEQNLSNISYYVSTINGALEKNQDHQIRSMNQDPAQSTHLDIFCSQQLLYIWGLALKERIEPIYLKFLCLSLWWPWEKLYLLYPYKKIQCLKAVPKTIRWSMYSNRTWIYIRLNNANSGAFFKIIWPATTTTIFKEVGLKYFSQSVNFSNHPKYLQQIAVAVADFCFCLNFLLLLSDVCNSD